MAIASQLEQALTPQVDVIQVTATANRNPTPPAVDVYPDDPFEEPDTYGIVNQRAIFVVRARVTDLDNDSGQTLLLDLMDPTSPRSVAAALAADGSRSAGPARTPSSRGRSGGASTATRPARPCSAASGG